MKGGVDYGHKYLDKVEREHQDKLADQKSNADDDRDNSNDDEGDDE